MKRVRGDLHGHAVGAGPFQRGEDALRLHRVGRGMGGRLQRSREAVAHSAGDGAAPGFRKRLGEEQADAGLAIGAGDAHHAHAARRLPMETGGDGACLLLQPLHDDQGRGARLLQPANPCLRPVATRLGQHQARAPGNGLVEMFQPMAALSPAGEKQVARLHFPAVQRHAGHRERHPAPFGYAQSLEQVARPAGLATLRSGGHQGCFSASARRTAWRVSRASGGTLSSRSASSITAANTGAATNPP